MLRVMFGGGLLLAAVLLIQPLAAEEKPAEEKKSPADQYTEMVADYAAAQAKFFAEYRKAKTPEEKLLAQKSYPQPAKFADGFLAFAEAHPDNPAAVDALTWIVSNVRVGPQADKAIDKLSTKYVDNPKIVGVCQMLVYNQSESAVRLLRAIMAKNKDRTAQAKSCFYLALNLKNSRQPKKAAEAEKLLERVAATYADVKHWRGTLGDQAEKELFELRNLAIGKTAPEIQGEDIDGVKFKLSDYRGKVVVLDFWGHW